MYKTCSKCKINLPISEYYLRADGQGFRSQCKKCHGGFKVITCFVCGEKHNRYATNRKSDVCVNCYDKYRTGYNLLASARDRAIKKNLKYDLTIEWILAQLNFCPITGIKYTFKDNGNNYKYRQISAPSIDKIDPNGGYTIDNCRVVCWWYNMAKSYYTDNEVLELCKRVVNSSGTRNVQNVEQMVEIGVGII